MNKESKMKNLDRLEYNYQKQMQRDRNNQLRFKVFATINRRLSENLDYIDTVAFLAKEF
jgi:hypothetical protein